MAAGSSGVQLGPGAVCCWSGRPSPWVLPVASHCLPLMSPGGWGWQGECLWEGQGPDDPSLALCLQGNTVAWVLPCPRCGA